ncbi:hypothetical protein C463_14680 [Halorubrum californiense DSM 19288]|uniref:Uncharacterized protein n=2 Tax=Haloferacaceae TaxID=1644056 RepID=M0E2K5_9EURY|nr:hypothetical protein C463_14680 [Halorubrum californiense DSM 19288]
MLPYEGFGVREVPLTVYSNQLLRPFLGQFDVNIVPFAIDATLRNRWRELLFHLLTNYMLANDREYIMLGFHDYDLLGAGLFSRLTRYIRLLRIKTCPTMVTNL